MGSNRELNIKHTDEEDTLSQLAETLVAITNKGNPQDIVNELRMKGDELGIVSVLSDHLRRKDQALSSLVEQISRLFESRISYKDSLY